MTVLNIQREKVSQLNQLDFSQKRDICMQGGANGTAIKLTLGRRLYKGKHMISLEGIAYQGNKVVKNSLLGHYKPDSRGAENILSACDCYTYDSMFNLIIA